MHALALGTGHQDCLREECCQHVENVIYCMQILKLAVLILL